MKTLPSIHYSRVVSGVMAAIVLLGVQPAVRADASATLILHSGKIITLGPGNEIGEAIAIRDGLVLKVGKTADILKLKDTATRLVDLHGRTVIPGLIESHDARRDRAIDRSDGQEEQARRVDHQLANLERDEARREAQSDPCRSRSRIAGQSRLSQSGASRRGEYGGVEGARNRSSHGGSARRHA
jgi:hypothetical protein